MKELGVGAYRFSIAWPRVRPGGTGPANREGLDFYDRLVDELLDNGIAPWATLFHWDLPQELEDAGGWLNRDTSERFGEYAAIAYERLGDRVGGWITLNEAVVVAALGYAQGIHAPGHELGPTAFPVIHHLLLGHGLAVQALRAAGATNVGITQNKAPSIPADPADPSDVDAAARVEEMQNHTYTDPILLGRYPERLAQLYPGGDLSVIRDGDLAIISSPIEFLGINYYFPNKVAHSDTAPLGFEDRPIEGVERTGFGWPVVPSAFTTMLVGLRDRYGDTLPPVYITENGSAWEDKPDADGVVDDDRRIAYLDSHLRAVHAAIEAGVDIRGYFAWSLMDNFEWAEGYAQRFGLVRVDFETLERTPKASYHWYSDLIARR
jgi:beta-glucosidase